MAYNHQSRADVPAKIFSIMPGDGTVYRFGYFNPMLINHRVTIETEHTKEYIDGNPVPKQVGQPIAESELYHFLEGVGDGAEYVYVWIDSSQGTEMTWLHRYSLEHFDHRILRELLHRFPNTYIYTLTACLLALTVLIKNPSDLIGACKKALETPALLLKYQTEYPEKDVNDNEEDEL
jgi:hypothetical protein